MIKVQILRKHEVGLVPVLRAESAGEAINLASAIAAGDVTVLDITMTVPGALTPTEILTAWQAGAGIVKVFPAGAMGGASYIRSLKAPFPQIEMVPTGGVSLETALSFLEAGAFGLGVGADLVDVKAHREGRHHDITAQARSYLKIVRQHKERQAAGA